MTTFFNERFSDQEIVVDGNQYDGCTFTNCILIFEGGEPPTFDRCSFQTIKIQLRGPAARTTNYLSSLFNSGLPGEVELVLTDIQTGLVDLPDIPAPCPDTNEGNNYRQLGFIALAMVVAVVWLFGMHVWGFIYEPNARLARGEFLETEIDFAQVPALPDTLAEAYDQLTDGHLERINQIVWVDQMQGRAAIPIGAALEIMVETGFGEPVQTGISDPSQIHQQDDDLDLSESVPDPIPADDAGDDMDDTDDNDAPADDATDEGEASDDTDDSEDAEDGATDEGVAGLGGT